CVLAAGFALFDAGLMPTLVTDMTVGSSLDRPGKLGIELWQHHFRQVTTAAHVLAELAGQSWGKLGPLCGPSPASQLPQVLHRACGLCGRGGSGLVSRKGRKAAPTISNRLQSP